MSLLDDSKAMLSSLVSEGMDKVCDEIATQVGREVQAEMVKQTDELMRDLGALRGVKQAVDLGLERINSTSEYLNEVVQSITLLDSKVDSINRTLLSKMELMSRDLAVKFKESHAESIAFTRSQLSAMSALLSELLKVCSKNELRLSCS